MKMVKSLLLGAAAGIVAMSGAQAADLPVKAKPVQYVKICSLYGAGFYYIPGTDTCLKLGGWVRVEIGLNEANSGAIYNNGAGGRDTKIDNAYAPIRARFVLTTDTRTQTEYGTLRTYTRAGMQNSTGDYNQGGTYFERAFIQIGGFTFGKTQSFFDFMGGAFSYSGYYGGYSNTGAGGTDMFAYTASFGNGFSATLAAENASLRYGVIDDAGFGPLTIGVAPGPSLISDSSYPGYTSVAGPIGNQAKAQMPDIVGNLRVDQAWGSAQVMGAIHQLNAGYYLGTVPGNAGYSTAPSTAYAWALGGGVSVNLPWAKGDKAFVEATATKGAMCYVGMCQNGTQMAYDRWTGSSVVFGWAFDSVVPFAGATGTPGQELTNAWAITGGVEHYWNPNLRTSLYGAYTSVSYDDTAKAAICGQNIAGGTIARGSICEPDMSELAIGSKTVWNPAPGFDVGLELIYTNIHNGSSGTFTTTVNTGGRPPGAYSIGGDADTFSGIFRVQRNFWP